MTSKQRGLVAFSIVTAIVVGLLVYLHLFGSPYVPQPQRWSHSKNLYVCDTAPEYAHDERRVEALELVKSVVTYDEIVDTKCDSEHGFEKCTFEDDRELWCKRGHVVLDLDDGKVDHFHLDETLSLWDLETNHLNAVVILVPSKMDPPVHIDPDAEYPPNIEMLVLAHSFVHADGYDHVRTDLFGPFSSIPTGALMNPKAVYMGDSLIGLE